MMSLHVYFHPLQKFFYQLFLLNTISITIFKLDINNIYIKIIDNKIFYLYKDYKKAITTFEENRYKLSKELIILNKY